MPTILDPIPTEVQIDLNKPKADLDNIPFKKLDKNLLIVIWKIRAFGSLTENQDLLLHINTEMPS